MEKYILTIDCPDTIGIVRAASNFFYDLGYSIYEAAEYADLRKQRFFARWAFGSVDEIDHALGLEDISRQFKVIADEFRMNWSLFDAQQKPKLLLAVSQYGHCLDDLLYRWKEEDHFPAEIIGVVSNHEIFKEKVEWYGLPFYYLPVSPETKSQQEQKILSIMAKNQVDVLVLARYMQILSDPMCQQLKGRAINIHHSFLPGFKGAKPYQQAHDRGVKVSGATAHYVTSDLDEGPIIEQDVQRHEHTHNAAEMARLGKNIERLVLARALYWHCQHRIILDGHRTIIFK